MKVKICGVTDPEDANYAAGLGADYIGMIFFDRSKRNISLPAAKAIARVTKEGGAEPIGVFVDKTAEQIVSICEQTGIHTVQLHGIASQQSLLQLLNDYSIIYAISVESNGAISQTQTLPASVIPLYDHLKGGTGVSFDWKSFSPPNYPRWILAGGLNPDNIGEAIALMNPSCVDVANGVEYPRSTRKNPLLVKAFIKAAKNIKEKV